MASETTLEILDQPVIDESGNEIMFYGIRVSHKEGITTYDFVTPVRQDLVAIMEEAPNCSLKELELLLEDIL